jgi:hypothetical protein
MIRDPRIGRRTVLVAPRVVLEPVAVLEHQGARPGGAAQHRLADLLTGRERAHAGQALDGACQRHRLRAAQALGGEHRCRQRCAVRIDRGARAGHAAQRGGRAAVGGGRRGLGPGRRRRQPQREAQERRERISAHRSSSFSSTMRAMKR